MNYTNVWLNYYNINNDNTSDVMVYTNGVSATLENAIKELKYGFNKLYNRNIIVTKKESDCMEASASIQLLLNPIDIKDGVEKQVVWDNDEIKNRDIVTNVRFSSYSIKGENGKTVISAVHPNGLLYGVFALLRHMFRNQVSDYDQLNLVENKTPSNPLRMLNHWDNLDGSIERGYSGNSFFFERDEILMEEGNGYKRICDYARMIASVGINGVTINNVNVKHAATELISKRYYDKLNRMAKVFKSYGISLFLSINFAAPIELAGIKTSDPCEEEVINWWMEKSKEVYENIPDLGGYLVKADSEGRPGPFTYGRSHADGANMLANSIKEQGGLVIWRCFVYNCKQDWRDKVTDRARAGYDNFMPIDGHFADNVILQIKNGPMDFQVREPISPLFGGLKNTNMMLEVQIAQEYTGQQRHVCYLIPWFKEILEFNTYCKEAHGTIADIVSGKTYSNSYCGMVAVTNTGNDENWTGHDLAAANLYGFGRLSFDTSLSSNEIGLEWIHGTFGYNEKVKDNILKILMMSWPAYEKYTSPLGIGWMVKPNHHYGPDVDGYEYDRWGTYHRADHKGIGVNRTENGTGYCNQYNEPLRSMFADMNTCPEELLLFFHHVEYTHQLSTGKTVIQHIYDAHFEGAKEAELFYDLWMELQEHIDPSVFSRGKGRFAHQREHAKEWCDVINSYFYRKTGIKDRMGRELY